MVKPAFIGIDVDLWIYPRKLGVTEPAVCLFRNRLGAGGQLLDALAELIADDPPAQRVLTFRGCARPLALRQLKLQLVSINTDLKVMHIGSAGDTATIAMTDVGHGLLRNAVAAWLAGGEDFGVSPRHSELNLKEFGRLDRESGELWFWGPGYDGP